MKCPHCGLLNPVDAIRCDCGYDFESATLKDSYLPVGSRNKRRRSWGREYAISCGIATLASMVFSVIPGGQAMISPGFLVATKIFPGVGAHDMGFMPVLIIAFLINGAVLGFVVFAGWRGLRSLIR